MIRSGPNRVSPRMFLLVGGILGILSIACEVTTPPDRCQGPEFPEEDFSFLGITQGIAGYVWAFEGDFMPCAASGRITPVRRWVLLYTQLADSQVQVVSTALTGFLGRASVAPLDSVRSDGETGFYEISLEPGLYSILVREDSLLYFFGNHRVGVFPDSITRKRIEIRAKAVG